MLRYATASQPLDARRRSCTAPTPGTAQRLPPSAQTAAALISSNRGRRAPPRPRGRAGQPMACRLPRAHAAARRYPRTAHATRAPRTPAAIRAAACAAEKKLGGVLCRCFILGAGSLDHAIRDKPCVDDRATRCRCLLRDRPLKKQYLQGKIFPSPKPSKVVNIAKVQWEEFLNTHIDTNSSFDMISNLPPFHTRP